MLKHRVWLCQLTCLVFQSWCHGFLLWIHLGCHHLGVPDMYPFAGIPHILADHSWEKSITCLSDFSWLVLRSPPQKRRDRQAADSSKLTQGAGISLDSLSLPEITSEKVVSIPVSILSHNSFRTWVFYIKLGGGRTWYRNKYPWT